MVPESNKASNDRPEKVCAVCKGKGVVPVQKGGAGAAGNTLATVTCPACHGQKTGPGLMRK